MTGAAHRLAAADGPTRRRPAAHRLGRVGVLLLGLLLAVAVLGPLLAPYDPAARVAAPFARPSLAHPLGANDVGQDLLTELLYGARVSLLVGGVAALVATAVGTVVGLLAGGAGGLVDAALMRLVDMVLALPLVPLTLAIGVFLGPGLGTQILVIAAVTWAGAARELRAQVLSLRERDDVLAARAMGAGPWWIARHHLLRAVVPLIVPQFVLAAKSAILLEATLSFLGLGDPTTRSWGTTLSLAFDRSAFLTGAWLWWVVPPGLAIAAAVLAFALVGYGLEERVGAAAPDRLPAGGAVPASPAPAEGAVPASPAPADGAGAGLIAPPEPLRDDAVLAVRGLRVAYRAPSGERVAVAGIDLQVAPGEAVGLVGESGSGKSTVVAAALGLLGPDQARVRGRRNLVGLDLDDASDEQLRRLRGAQVALVPQDAMSALDPLRRVGAQIAAALRLHQAVTRREARARAAALLQEVGIPADRSRAWPHELSGGMRQRAVVAIALANRPRLLVADEPTNGLDLVRQAELLTLLTDLRGRHGLALLLVSHDLPFVLQLTDRMAVMRAGVLVEQGPTAALAAAAAHPYTRRLLQAVPRLPAVSEAGG